MPPIFNDAKSLIAAIAKPDAPFKDIAENKSELFLNAEKFKVQANLLYSAFERSGNFSLYIKTAEDFGELGERFPESHLKMIQLIASDRDLFTHLAIAANTKLEGIPYNLAIMSLHEFKPTIEEIRAKHAKDLLNDVEKKPLFGNGREIQDLAQLKDIVALYPECKEALYQDFMRDEKMYDAFIEHPYDLAELSKIFPEHQDNIIAPYLKNNDKTRQLFARTCESQLETLRAAFPGYDDMLNTKNLRLPEYHQVGQIAALKNFSGRPDVFQPIATQIHSYLGIREATKLLLNKQMYHAAETAAAITENKALSNNPAELQSRLKDEINDFITKHFRTLALHDTQGNITESLKKAIIEFDEAALDNLKHYDIAPKEIAEFKLMLSKKYGEFAVDSQTKFIDDTFKIPAGLSHILTFYTRAGIKSSFKLDTDSEPDDDSQNTYKPTQ